jgi:hypothetical protein
MKSCQPIKRLKDKKKKTTRSGGSATSSVTGTPKEFSQHCTIVTVLNPYPANAENKVSS